MAARDKYHDAVRVALEKDGWTITDDPLILETDLTNMYVDLAAERIISATKDTEIIAVEIKSFLSLSPLSDFHVAVGQCLNYRVMLGIQSMPHRLCLAVPKDVYTSFFESPFVQTAIQAYALPVIVFDPETESIFKWTK